MKIRRYAFCPTVLAGALLCLAAATGTVTANDLLRQEALIRSTPAGATVTVNGSVAGVTPLTLGTLPAGDHLISVSLRDHRTQYRTLTLEPGERKLADFQLERLNGLVLIHSTPEEADVEIDGAHRGKTPLLVTDLPRGEYRATLSKTGYLSRRLNISIEGRLPKRFTANLSTDAATLHVHATPHGATVLLDGENHGKTPLVIDRVRTGQVRLEITAPGFHPHAETLQLAAGEVREIGIGLRAIPASLQILTSPEGARIHVNDRYRGRAPITLPDLAAGEYTIRAELDAHESLVRQLHLPQATEHVEELRLEPNAGRLELTTEPAGVRVLLNGVRIGETEAADDQTDRISSTFIAELIEPGEHELALARPGYYPFTRTIKIERNKTFTDHIALQRRFIPDIEVETEGETYRGVLIEMDAARNIKIEMHPGIFKTIQRSDIIAVTPLRAPDVKEVVTP